ncbi:hypothetical protein JS80_09955 [Anoxybacillus sp. KU2-6(11)]|nr:hypothetical protein JS80_09955 [Anoxybacillus sp. KU2-6(11)]
MNVSGHEQWKQINISAFSDFLFRQELLPNLFGKETPFILYWAGKDLARKYPLATIDDVIAFFEQAGWGNLSLLEEKKDQCELRLEGPLVAMRFDYGGDCTFQLEAGFLAQQFEQQKGYVTEAFEQQKRRAKIVLFTVKWDRKDES